MRVQCNSEHKARQVSPPSPVTALARAETTHRAGDRTPRRFAEGPPGLRPLVGIVSSGEPGKENGAIRLDPGPHPYGPNTFIAAVFGSP